MGVNRWAAYWGKLIGAVLFVEKKSVSAANSPRRNEILLGQKEVDLKNYERLCFSLNDKIVLMK